jgi:hypothetical protein
MGALIRGRGAPALVALLAVAVRWRLVGGWSGVRALHGYDDGVYYSAAAAFVHGRMPYRDFTLVHPPGVVLALSPFAALGRLVGDADGFVAARIAVILVGAVNALLVMRLARRWGVAASVVAGVLYAVLSTAAFAERTTLLEPWGTLTLLGGVLLLVKAREQGRVTLLWLGGAVLGLGALVKIWDVVPLVVVLAWQAATRGPRVAARVAGGAVGALALVAGPFLVAAPDRMPRLVLVDQLGRPRYVQGLGWRMTHVLGLDTSAVPGPRGPLLALVLAAVVATAVAAWRLRRGRFWVVLLAVQVAVLMASPSFLQHYSAFAAAALVLVVAAGVSTVRVEVRARVAVATCAVLAVAVGAFASQPPTRTFPLAQVRAALPAEGCIQADSPGALALAGVLSRDLDEGCALPVDLSGQSFDVGDRTVAGRPVERWENVAFQKKATSYFASGVATIIARGGPGDGFSGSTISAIMENRRLAVDTHGVEVFVDPSAPASPALRADSADHADGATTHP